MAPLASSLWSFTAMFVNRRFLSFGLALVSTIASNISLIISYRLWSLLLKVTRLVDASCRVISSVSCMNEPVAKLLRHVILSLPISANGRFQGLRHRSSPYYCVVNTTVMIDFRVSNFICCQCNNLCYFCSNVRRVIQMHDNKVRCMDRQT